MAIGLVMLHVLLSRILRKRDLYSKGPKLVRNDSLSQLLLWAAVCIH